MNIKIPKECYFYLGDMDYFVNTGNSMKIVLILLALYSLLSQLINYQNYRNGIKPTDLRVFQMISGFITPNDISINDPIFVIKLCKMSKTMFKWTPNL